jgi:hypothetical protein
VSLLHVFLCKTFPSSWHKDFPLWVRVRNLVPPERTTFFALHAFRHTGLKRLKTHSAFISCFFFGHVAIAFFCIPSGHSREAARF